MSELNFEPKYAFMKPNTFARGWHIVMFSAELKVGEIKPIKYFNREMVIYRGESGKAAILDAYCPHLGAHLASNGGRLKGDCIACPFHGWTYDSEGTCVDIPYANSIPPKAVNALKAYPILEKNGFIAIWNDPENGEPDNYLPDIPVFGKGSNGEKGWGDWQFHRSRVRAKGCDVIENIVDVGHFGYVHGGKVREFENKFTEFTVTQISKVDRDPNADMIIPTGLSFDLSAVAAESLAAEADAWGDATYHGPAIMYYYTESRSEAFSYQSWWVNYHTPINDEEVDLCSAVIVNSLTDEPLPQDFIEQYPLTAHAAFWQDVEIWQDKMYQPEPILCDGDGPVNKLRRWYENFYLPRT